MKVKDIVKLIRHTQLKGSAVSVVNTIPDPLVLGGDITQVEVDERQAEINRLTAENESREFQIKAWVDLAIQDINTNFMLFYETKEYKSDGLQQIYNMPTDYMQTIAVLDRTGRRVAVNKEDDSTSVYTPTPRTFMIPTCWKEEVLLLCYVKSHKWISLETEVDPKDFDVPLPEQFVKAIMHYVSYLAFETIDNDPNYGHHIHLRDYSEELQRLELLGYKPNESIINSVFSMKGFR